MRSGAVARRYARALVALASEAGDPGSLADALERVAALLAEPSVARVLLNPALGVEDRRGVVGGMVGELKLPGLLANCLFLLAERQRLGMVGELWQAYVTLVDEQLGRTRVVVRSAVPLSEKQEGEILAVLRRLTGRENLIPALEVDGELLGGVVCEVAGVVYDGSTRSHVNQLARHMVTETSQGKAMVSEPG